MLVSLPGMAVACGELCYVAYGTDMAHATGNIQTKKSYVLCHCGHALLIVHAVMKAGVNSNAPL